MRYKSLFKCLEYGGYYKQAAYQAPNEYSVSHYASKYFIIYNQPSKEFTIRIGDIHNKGFRDYITCELPKQPSEEKNIKTKNILMLQLTNHTYQRDEAGLMSSIWINMNKIEAIINLNIMLPDDLNAMDYFQPTID